MKSKNSSCLTKILIIIIVLGMLVGLLGFFSDGFKDWSFLKKPSPDTPPTGKKIVSTTIVTDKYGTFEIPANSMLLQNNMTNMIFTDGTDFNYIWETELAKAKEMNTSVTDESELIFEYDSYHNLSEELLAGRAVTNNNGHHYFIPENRVVTFKFEGEAAQYKELYPLLVSQSMGLAVTLPNNTSISEIIYPKFYCKDIIVNFQEKEFIFLIVIISDKGCPLTDYIFDEIMADSSNKITYNYED